MLVIEADCSDSDVLNLSKRSSDLSPGEAAMAFSALHRHAERELRSSVRVLRVLLADSLQLRETGGGAVITLRDRVQRRGDCDVFVDSRASHSPQDSSTHLPRTREVYKRQTPTFPSTHTLCSFPSTRTRHFFFFFFSPAQN